MKALRIKILRRLSRLNGVLVRPCRTDAGFTLLEVLVATAVLALLLVMLLSVTSHTAATVRTASAHVDAFQSARGAFDTISQRLSQATMNTYWDYYDSANKPRTNASTFQPARYGRKSDQHFLIQTNSSHGQSVFFQAPEAVSEDPEKSQTQGLLNAIGYYVQYGSDTDPNASWHRPDVVPASVPARFRYRLMQAIEPTEKLQVFSDSTSGWTAEVKKAGWPLADNVIALIAWPRLSAVEDPDGEVITTDFTYDSRVTLPASSTSDFPIQYAQMPPTVQLTMVVIDEASAARLNMGAAEPKEISDALMGKFADVAKFEDDLRHPETGLEALLSKANIKFRVLTAVVSLRESKWSR